MGNDEKRNISAEKQESIKKVAVLVKELIGDRSLRKTSADSGVAASYLTGILKERYLPSAEILRRLASPEANPQNGITVEDLMISAGYQNRYQDPYDVQLSIFDVFGSEEDTDNKSEEKQEDAKDDKGLIQKEEKDSDISGKLNLKELELERERFKSCATGIIYKSLVEKRINLSITDDSMAIRGFSPDISVKVTGIPIKEWWFSFKIFCSSMKLRNDENRYKIIRAAWARNILGRLIFVEPKIGRKLSVVVRAYDEFEELVKFKDKLAFKGDLSVILVDSDNYCVMKEEYLAYYNNENSEVFIK